MQNHMKYIRSGFRFVVFSPTLVHADVARSLKMDLIHGAGFVVVQKTDDGLVANCYGRSVSLDVDSRKDDSEYLTKQLQGE